MGTYPCFDDVIDEDFVKEICPDEFQALIEALNKSEDITMETLARASFFGNDIEDELSCSCSFEEEDETAVKTCKDSISIISAYVNLCNKFKSIVELELRLNYHKKEDRGDEVDGYFWAVDGVYILSPAGEKYKDKIERKCWTVWG